LIITKEGSRHRKAALFRTQVPSGIALGQGRLTAPRPPEGKIVLTHNVSGEAEHRSPKNVSHVLCNHGHQCQGPSVPRSCGVTDGAQRCTVGVDVTVDSVGVVYVTGVQPTVPRSCGVTDGAQQCTIGVDLAVDWAGRGSRWPVSNPPSPAAVG
jgi:hypothetical protein